MPCGVGSQSLLADQVAITAQDRGLSLPLFFSLFPLFVFFFFVFFSLFCSQLRVKLQ